EDEKADIFFDHDGLDPFEQLMAFGLAGGGAEPIGQLGDFRVVIATIIAVAIGGERAAQEELGDAIAAAALVVDASIPARFAIGGIGVGHVARFDHKAMGMQLGLKAGGKRDQVGDAGIVENRQPQRLAVAVAN